MQDNLFKLKSGRRLSYADDGNPNGVPVFLFHGTPGSRINGLEGEPLLGKFGIRVICPERPGYGRSDPSRNRTMKEWASDIEELANALGLGQFHIAGTSGGGPFALACAIFLPTRVRSVTLIASAVPPEAIRSMKGMAIGNKIGFFLAKYAPILLKISFASYNRAIKKYPDKLMKSLLPQFCPWDRKVLQQADGKGEKLLLLHYQEAFRQGSEGAYSDMLLISKPWGLNLSDIAVPVFMWHGESDTLMPIAPAKKFAGMIPGCKTYFIPSAGHLLLESEDIGDRIVATILTAQSQTMGFGRESVPRGASKP